jgi:hypothetical protein
MRHDYHKELLNLREQLNWKERSREMIERGDPGAKRHAFQEIDVRYFDVTEDLPQPYCDLLNTKVREIKETFDSILSKVAHANDELYKRVDMLDRINGKFYSPTPI